MSLLLEELTHGYGDRKVLDRVTLQVRDGDCYGFLGHNGAGKTTALRIALGLIRPTAGRVLVDGIDGRENSLEARARLSGLVEVPGFHGHLSGRRNLLLLARLQGLSRGDARTEASRVLDVVALAHAAEKAAAAYS